MGRFTKLVEEKNTFSFISMIDVVFLLLIFFMVTAEFSQDDMLMKANLPTESGISYSEVIHTDPLMIFVKDDAALRRSENYKIKGSRKATYYLASHDATPVPDAVHLLPMLKRLSAQADIRVIIAPFDERVNKDQEVPFFNIMNVMDICKKAGIQKVSFQVPSKTSL